MNNYIFRAIEIKDLDNVLKLIEHNSGGMTSLIPSQEYLELQINNSIESFNKKSDYLKNEKYFFVMENIRSKEIVGISGLKAVVGVDYPFYSYKIN
ncbi:MAG: arginine N-succinyltransferase, partial [Legionellales bacterium]|nr:arginine N-succinyltransferase [Legionellales bacterium]